MPRTGGVLLVNRRSGRRGRRQRRGRLLRAKARGRLADVDVVLAGVVSDVEGERDADEAPRRGRRAGVVEVGGRVWRGRRGGRRGRGPGRAGVLLLEGVVVVVGGVGRQG